MSRPGRSKSAHQASVSDLTPRAQTGISRAAAPRSYATGAVLFDQDACAEVLVILTNGAVVLSRSACGRSLVLAREAAPAVIATPGLLDGGPNTIRATAACETSACLVPRADVLRICVSCPETLDWLLRHIGSQMRLLTSALDLITLGSVRQRLARVLFAMSESSGTANIALDCNQDQFALTIGTVREVLFRNLRGLQIEGILHFHGRNITIDNLDALKQTAGLTHRPCVSEVL